MRDYWREGYDEGQGPSGTGPKSLSVSVFVFVFVSVVSAWGRSRGMHLASTETNTAGAPRCGRLY